MTEEKHLKKEKKNKNGKASDQKKTCVNEGNLTDLDPGDQESCVRANEKAGKKKRKEKNITECLVNATNDEEISKTKKKKKKKQVGDYKVEAPLSKIQQSNNKKKKSKCADREHAEIDDDDDNDDDEEEAPKKAKKKRNKPGEQIKEKNNTAEKNTNDIDEKLVPKKHKKSKIILAENRETSKETEVEGERQNEMAPTPEDIKKTKKKEHGNTVSVAEINDDVKKKNKSAKSGDINVEEEKRKKKKARKTSLECADMEETKPRKNKKSKQDKQDEEKQSEENVDTRTDRKNRKRKERTTTEAEAPCTENGTKRKKKKKVKEEVEAQKELSQVDVVFLSVKNANADEVAINQERGQALQMKTDQASQPPKAANPSGLGQWSTAQFDSSEKQQKFLRLMGGFKKAFQPSAGTAARANMALGKDGQQQLQQKLLDEFDRAHSRRMDSSNRGAGIGFTAPANKTFFIDINASRSVRFDD